MQKTCFAYAIFQMPFQVWPTLPRHEKLGQCVSKHWVVDIDSDSATTYLAAGF